MLRRELAIALRSRVTWFAGALAALLVGHGFVLACDIFGSESRSALASALLVRGMDPLAGVVRPTFGGVELATAILVPLVACRVLAVEKERGGFGALVLQVGSPSRVLGSKGIAAGLAAALFLAPPLLLLLLFAATGGHLDAGEVAVCAFGHGLHLALVVAVALAAAAWTDTVALATTIAIVASLASWAVDASEGFTALAWLGGAERWSVTPHLATFDRGVFGVGKALWLASATVGAWSLAWIGVRFDWPARRRAALVSATVAATLALLAAGNGIELGFDATEARRMSLPPDVVRALRALPGPLEVAVWLDREDSRRTQLEREVLSKLRLARPDAAIRMPLDEQGDSHATAGAGERYGIIHVRAGGPGRETRASSTEEIVTLAFEDAGRQQPDWSQPEYPGYPFVLDGVRRTLVLLVAYLLLPLAFGGAGIAVTRSKRRQSRR